MTLLRALLAAFLSLTLATAAAAQPRAPARDNMDAIARDYVRLVLELGERDEGYVDAYYGPPAWRTAARANPRTLPQLAEAARLLSRRLQALRPPPATLAGRRQLFLSAQINAAITRLRMLQGERLSFREEALGLYGVDPQPRPLSEFDPVLARIERLVPGDGPLPQRVDAFMGRFVIPRDRLDAVMRAAIAECRRRTAAHIPLPRGEHFTLEFVTQRSWSGYNWYQGNYHSLIQVNTDQPVRMGRAIDLGCHEGYPGHHAYNMLLERNLARGRGWVEYMVYPLYSPQSFIAEGSANYGVELAFPGEERLAFERRVLYPLAGLPGGEADAYLRLQDVVEELSGARIAIAAAYLDGRIDRAEAIRLTQRYSLVSESRARQSIAFTDQYRSYVINYGLGEELVGRFVEWGDAPLERRWRTMARMLSEPFLPSALQPVAR
ncbi:MAG TPA: hypothetical protein VEC11_07580 [Allosphingosinicella sp.]|nr:hypothetical protein [Allosphingosinicella sp.]